MGHFQCALFKYEEKEPNPTHFGHSTAPFAYRITDKMKSNVFREVCMKGTLLHFLLLAITMKYVQGSTEDNDHIIIPPLSAPKTIAANPIPTPEADVGSTAGPTLSFFMHDIFGGSAPSLRVVAGIIATNQKQQQQQQFNRIPFSKPIRGVFPKHHGVPLITTNNVINDNGNNNLVGRNSKELLFGTITVIDDELTEGLELGSFVMGKAQGFYLASSMDGTSHTMAFTAMFHDADDHEKDDAISFFGVHRTAAVGSHIAVVGGTGNYENAGGYAVIETLHQTNQHTTDGIDTLLQFSVFVTH